MAEGAPGAAPVRAVGESGWLLQETVRLYAGTRRLRDQKDRIASLSDDGGGCGMSCGGPRPGRSA